MIKKGDRVYLKEGKWEPACAYNPAKGSEWFCYGTVTSITAGHPNVLWDNGEPNSYNPGDLEKIDPINDMVEKELFEI